MDLISIVHMGTIWVEIAKIFEMRTSGGRGVFSDFGHPRTRGGGGSKKGKFLRTSFMDGPLHPTEQRGALIFALLRRIQCSLVSFSWVLGFLVCSVSRDSYIEMLLVELLLNQLTWLGWRVLID